VREKDSLASRLRADVSKGEEELVQLRLELDAQKSKNDVSAHLYARKTVLRESAFFGEFVKIGILFPPLPFFLVSQELRSKNWKAVEAMNAAEQSYLKARKQVQSQQEVSLTRN